MTSVVMMGRRINSSAIFMTALPGFDSLPEWTQAAMRPAAPSVRSEKVEKVLTPV